MKRIDDIKPFNDLFYRSCFYNCLFPIIEHFNKSILPIILNDVLVYDAYMDGELEVIKSNYLENQELKDDLHTMGIIIEESNAKKDLNHSIINAIDRNKPVILWIDTFYESIRKDTFGKKHGKHTILIHGYDRDKGLFNVIEHKHRDTLSYGKCEMSFNDVENSYKGYLENFKDRKEYPSYFEFSNFTTQNTEVNYQKLFISNIEEKENEIFAGSAKLMDFLSVLKEILIDVERLDLLKESIINSLNSIINAKKIEIYKLNILFGREVEMLKLQEECINLWVIIRAKLVKYRIMKKYNIQSFQDSLEVLNLIYNLELDQQKRLSALLYKENESC